MRHLGGAQPCLFPAHRARALAVALVERVGKLGNGDVVESLPGKRLLPTTATAFALRTQIVPAGAPKRPDATYARASTFARGGMLVIRVIKHANVSCPTAGAAAQAVGELAGGHRVT